MNKWHEKEIAKMILEVSGTTKPEDLCELFNKILTPREINDVARRLAIINMLEAGLSYSDITMRLGVGSNTISKVSANIGYGFRRGDITKDKNKTKRLKIIRSSVKYKGSPTYKIVFK